MKKTCCYQFLNPEQHYLLHSNVKEDIHNIDTLMQSRTGLILFKISTLNNLDSVRVN